MRSSSRSVVTPCAAPRVDGDERTCSRARPLQAARRASRAACAALPPARRSSQRLSQARASRGESRSARIRAAGRSVARSPHLWFDACDDDRRSRRSALRVKVPGNTLAEILPNLRETYAGQIAYEIEHISNREQRVAARLHRRRIASHQALARAQGASARSSHEGRDDGALHAQEFPRPEDVLDRRSRRDDPDARRDHHDARR